MPRPEPLRRPDPVQRLRVRYAKTGVMRFASHRDIARALERALRRAEIPVAYSSGFSPHPRLSYANPAPTGVASWAEYLHLGLAESRDPDEVRELLTAALPAGLPVTCVREIEPGEKLASLLTASLWLLEWGPDVDAERIIGVAERLMNGSDDAVVRRQSGRGERVLDVRASLCEVDWLDSGLGVLLAHGTPSVRPDDVVAALRMLDSDLDGAVEPLITRQAQGKLVDAATASPGRILHSFGKHMLQLPPGESSPMSTGVGLM